MTPTRYRSIPPVWRTSPAMVGPSCCSNIAYVAQGVDDTRIDSGGNRLAAVSNQQSGSPSPTVAATLGIGDRLVLAAGIAAPYAGLHRNADDGPQRYASVSLAGSAFLYIYVTLGGLPGNFDALAQDTQTDYIAPRRSDRTTI